MATTMTHEALPDREITVDDTTVAVHAKSGWIVKPESPAEPARDGAIADAAINDTIVEADVVRPKRG